MRECLCAAVPDLRIWIVGMGVNALPENIRHSTDQHRSATIHVKLHLCINRRVTTSLARIAPCSLLSPGGQVHMSTGQQGCPLANKPYPFMSAAVPVISRLHLGRPSLVQPRHSWNTCNTLAQKTIRIEL
jgi:hypothetical protein